MNILSWNIQATMGCDNRFDAARIVDQIKSFGELDAICLQEVSRHIADLNADDQLALIGNEFPGYEHVWAPGFSVPNDRGKRGEFGNLTLVKAELLVYSHVHSLPSPAVNTLQIPRTMAEVIIKGGDKLVALFNTHLAFHSSEELTDQIQELTRLRDQLVLKFATPNTEATAGPYSYTRSSDAVILCGDLNVDAEDRLFKDHISDRNWIDCWSVQSRFDGKIPSERQPTCGCFDRAQWPQGPHVRDFFLATENIASKTIRVEVDVETDASDHQPVLLESAL